MIPEQARQFYTEQRALQARALRVLAAIWGDRTPDDFDAWFAANVDDMVATLTAAQTEAAGQGLDYVGAVLDEQGGDISPDVDVDPSPLVGVAGDGRALDSLLYGSVISARRAIARAPEVNLASIRDGWVNAGLAALTTRAQTVIADTSRVATGLGIISRPGVGYTRMLVGSSCSRCAILAGRVYRSRDAFDRHPRCDCRHIAARASDLEDRTVDARSYFESLSQSEQDREFTAAGAQAIRDGADPAQVVNARRGAGLSFASGRLTNDELAAIRRGRPRAQVLPTTTEATTKRGWAGKRMRMEGTPMPRLMPEAIYQAARTREDAVELLGKYGYTALPPELKRKTPRRRGDGSGDDYVDLDAAAEKGGRRRRSKASGTGPPRKPPAGRATTGGGDFERDRAAYRSTPIDKRDLDPRFADDLGTVLDEYKAGHERYGVASRRLARDLSGRVRSRGRRGDGEFIVDFHEVEPGADQIVMRGTISRVVDGRREKAGPIERIFSRDDDGRLVVDNAGMYLNEESDDHEGRGFATAFAPRLERYYQRSGVDRIEVFAAAENGGYTWARQDFRWDKNKLDKSIDNIVGRLHYVRFQATTREDREAIDAMLERLTDGGAVRPIDELPTPREIAGLRTQGTPDLGAQVMLGSNWYGVKKLSGGASR